MKRTMMMAVMVLILPTMAMGAATYQFEDMIDTWTVAEVDAILITEACPLTYTHDVTDDVDFAAGHRVVEAYLELDFTNDLTDGTKLWGIVKWDFREFTTVAYDGSQWITIGEVDDGQYEIVVDIDWLNDDGKLDVTLTVSNELGTATAWLDHSRLYGTAAVPAPGAILLAGLGTGLVGAIRRRYMA